MEITGRPAGSENQPRENGCEEEEEEEVYNPKCCRDGDGNNVIEMSII
ncbi:hypothetical protein KAS79_01300 [Candidatus Parcubacteria bacterium]|nr:hypothetical protein [Candidatus Parcubacteria bacterium]